MLRFVTFLTWIDGVNVLSTSKYKEIIIGLRVSCFLLFILLIHKRILTTIVIKNIGDQYAQS